MGTTPTIEQVFGPGSTQTATQITISKSWMSQFGLVPSVNDVPEALLAAVLWKASEQLTETRRAQNRDDQFLTITTGEYDEIRDVPGTPSQVRRDVATAILYTPVAEAPFSLARFES